jgi:arginine-tRNA-protein transferase
MYQTEMYPCAYLPNQTAAMMVLDPAARLDLSLYSDLLLAGFRRSGEQVYRPHCPSCQACIPLRIAVEHFQPSRSQRRVWCRNQDLQVRIIAAGYSDEQFELYRRYIAAKHPDGGMDDPAPSDYTNFLLARGVETRFIEVRYRQRLLAIAVTDLLDDGLSAVYTFYDTDMGKRSLGVFSLLRQIDYCRELTQNYLYLGYWIGACSKMRYKQDFRPCQVLTARGWQVLD